MNNSTLLIGDVLSPYTIFCNQSSILAPNQQISWIHTINKTGAYLIQNSSISSFYDNGNRLYFPSLVLTNEEYYSCGYLSNNKFEIIGNYFLFIKG